MTMKRIRLTNPSRGGFSIIASTFVTVCLFAGATLAQTQWNRIEVGGTKIYIPEADGFFEYAIDPWEFGEIFLVEQNRELKAKYRLLPPDARATLAEGRSDEVREYLDDLSPSEPLPSGEVMLFSIYGNDSALHITNFFNKVRINFVNDAERAIKNNIDERIDQLNRDIVRYEECLNSQTGTEHGDDEFEWRPECQNPALNIVHGRDAKRAVINGSEIELGLFIEEEGVIGVTSILTDANTKSFFGDDFRGVFIDTDFLYGISAQSIKVVSNVWLLVKDKILIIQATKNGVETQQDIDWLEIRLAKWVKEIVEYNRPGVAEKIDPEPNAVMKFVYTEIWPPIKRLVYIVGLFLSYLALAYIVTRLHAIFMKIRR